MSIDYQPSAAFAAEMDQRDELAAYRQKFHFPVHEGQPVIYLCGNSLGLQPKAVKDYLDEELEAWQTLGVEGHFNGERPWFHYHKFFQKPLAHVMGALPHEVVAMNNLTSNLHFLLTTFYRPDDRRFKIITEAKPFPSDSYALETQAQLHGLDPDDAIIEVPLADGELNHKKQAILDTISTHSRELALVMMGGVQYYTGQFFPLEDITKAAHDVGVVAGFDLAHAAGNVPLRLHDWGVDFAVWCSYKYLNSGPGGVGGAYIHERHASNVDLPRMGGWWGHDEQERFLMQKGFKPIPDIAGWQVSNASVFNMAPHLASLHLFEEVGMDKLREKSLKLTGYLEFLINEINKEGELLELITPSQPMERGCQLSLFIKNGNKQIFENIQKRGVVADWREPNVIRVAPVPFYNSYMDVWQFCQILSEELATTNIS